MCVYIYIYIYILLYFSYFWFASCKALNIYNSRLITIIIIITANKLSLFILVHSSLFLPKSILYLYSFKETPGEKLDEDYARILQQDVSNKSWKQHPSKQQLYSDLPSILQANKIKRARHAEHYERSENDLISNDFLWTTTVVYSIQ